VKFTSRWALKLDVKALIYGTRILLLSQREKNQYLLKQFVKGIGFIRVKEINILY
jgi:hypothetical protein